MDISSTSPAPSLSSPKSRPCSSPLRRGPNPSDWTTPAGSAGLFAFHLLLDPRWGRGMSPDLRSTQVISASQKKDVFLAHSRAAPRPRSSSALLPSITAPLLEIPALNFPASCTPSSATFRHCLFQRNRSHRANQYLLLWLLPEPHGPSAPSPGTQDPGDNMLIWEKYFSVLLIDGNVFHPSDVKHCGKLLKNT